MGDELFQFLGRGILLKSDLGQGDTCQTSLIELVAVVSGVQTLKSILIARVLCIPRTGVLEGETEPNNVGRSVAGTFALPKVYL